MKYAVSINGDLFAADENLTADEAGSFIEQSLYEQTNTDGRTVDGEPQVFEITITTEPDLSLEG